MVAIRASPQSQLLQTSLLLLSSHRQRNLTRDCCGLRLHRRCRCGVHNQGSRGAEYGMRLAGLLVAYSLAAVRIFSFDCHLFANCSFPIPLRSTRCPTFLQRLISGQKKLHVSHPHHHVLPETIQKSPPLFREFIALLRRPGISGIPR